MREIPAEKQVDSQGAGLQCGGGKGVDMLYRTGITELGSSLTVFSGIVGLVSSAVAEG